MKNTHRPVYANCGCGCARCCENLDRHCLTGSCTRKRNRRNAEQLKLCGPKNPPRIRRPKPKEPKPVVVQQLSSTRTEWFIHAHKGTTTVELPCPDGRDDACVGVDQLTRHGWDDCRAYSAEVPRNDPRFHRLPKEVVAQ